MLYLVQLDQRPDGDAIQDALLDLTGGRSVPVSNVLSGSPLRVLSVPAGVILVFLGARTACASTAVHCLHAVSTAVNWRVSR